MADDIDNDKNMPEYGQDWWKKQIEDTERILEKKWWTAAENIISRYLDDRSDMNEGGDLRRYNIFWANVQIMMAALYATPPSPNVRRQNSDPKDDIGRVAALILERASQTELTRDGESMHTALRNGVEDRLVPGMGQVWLRYDAVFDSDGVTLLKETAPCDYVHYRDFLWSPSRTWDEVWWVGRRCWMKKKAFIQAYGEESYREIRDSFAENSTSLKDKGLPEGFKKGRVEVFELWCEDTNTVYFVNRHAKDILKKIEDPLKLDGFFPCPRPLLATVSTRSLIPRADFTMVRDQYEELDNLNDRISVLVKALRVVGMYDKTNVELKNLLSGPEFSMVPVDNWDSFSEKGGIGKIVDWFPVEVIADVLMKLVEQRTLLVGQIYELTSISDIMRGASSPRETAKAQTLKAQYSSVRLQLVQQAVMKWVSQAISIRAEIMCKHFQPQTLKQISQIEFTESAPLADQAIALLKDFKSAEYRIDIGEETLSLADYNAERELRTEYLTSVGQFISQAGMILDSRPDAMPFLLKMVSWVTSSFRGSADMETVLDQAITAASQPLPPQDNGESAKAQAEVQKAEIAEQGRQASDQLKLAVAKLQTESSERIAQMNNETKTAIELMKQQFDQGMAEMEGQQEETRQQLDVMLERMRMAQEAVSKMFDQENANAERELQAEQSDMDRESEIEEPEDDEKTAKNEAAQAMLIEVLGKLAAAIEKPKKRRVTARDKDGNIQEVEEL
jgi:hypothetical protein